MRNGYFRKLTLFPVHRSLLMSCQSPNETGVELYNQSQFFGVCLDVFTDDRGEKGMANGNFVIGFLKS